MGDLAPDPELWTALGEGERLGPILEDFYTRVYADARLSPFFEGLTKEWISQKQYNFLRAKFTGEKIYFGNLPRHAHHWMVISDELFDHREALMEACLRAAGLPEHLVDRWLGVEEVFRKQIVKAAAVPLKVNGTARPLEGYEELTTEIGTLCDGCGAPVDVGIVVRCHVRTGRLYCGACRPSIEIDGEDTVGDQAIARSECANEHA
jgi:truncated hemoglobin YjbI